AFGVLRSRMTANTVPRWTSFHEYEKLLAGLADLARENSGIRWRSASKSQEEQNWLYRENGPLHAEELAWLYNELGLAYYLEGAVLDALGIWHQGHDINRLVDSEELGGQYIFQSNCNLGAANLQYGRLGVATVYFHEARAINHRLGKDPDHEGRIL